MLYTVIIWLLCVQRVFAANVARDGGPSAASSGRRAAPEKRAFDLAQLEARFEAALAGDVPEAETQRLLQAAAPGASRHRDDVTSDARCQADCDRRLHSGLDMVKAHNAFGSLGLPSLIDEFDLRLFCHLDNEHSACLALCGFTVTFNMRDYVCKERASEMTTLLPCYARAAATLKRRCGRQRCGPYEDEESVEHRSAASYDRKCAAMICDVQCTRAVLNDECGKRTGERAVQFMIDYTKIQVKQWISDLAEEMKSSISTVIPQQCRRIFCNRFETTNCTPNELHR